MKRYLATMLLAFASVMVLAEEPGRSIEQALGAAQQDKRGITLFLNGQAVSGAVLRVEPGQWVELRNQQFSRLVVRLDRVDGIALP